MKLTLRQHIDMAVAAGTNLKTAVTVNFKMCHGVGASQLKKMEKEILRQEKLWPRKRKKAKEVIFSPPVRKMLDQLAKSDGRSREEILRRAMGLYSYLHRDMSGKASDTLVGLVNWL